MERVLSALNYITGEGVSYYPEECDTNAIDALISDYSVNAPIDDDDSNEELSHKNSGWSS